jgi:hypothetical protein
LQGFDIEDFDFATAVFDHPGILQCMGDDRHTGTSDPKHFANEFLREQKRSAIGQVE